MTRAGVQLVPDLNQIVTEAIQSGRYRTASALLKEALFAAHKQQKIDQELIAEANTFADVLCGKSEYQGAAALYRHIMLVQQNVFGPHHPAVLETSRKLCVALCETGWSKPAI